MTPLTDIRCACGSADVILLDPGESAQIDVTTDIVTRRGRPVSGRCLGCWPMAAGFQQELFRT